jgi:hypothetical protein
MICGDCTTQFVLLDVESEDYTCQHNWGVVMRVRDWVETWYGIYQEEWWGSPKAEPMRRVTTA